jgi:hypothetical protein
MEAGIEVGGSKDDADAADAADRSSSNPRLVSPALIADVVGGVEISVPLLASHSLDPLIDRLGGDSRLRGAIRASAFSASSFDSPSSISARRERGEAVPLLRPQFPIANSQFPIQ